MTPDMRRFFVQNEVPHIHFRDSASLSFDIVIFVTVLCFCMICSRFCSQQRLQLEQVYFHYHCYYGAIIFLFNFVQAKRKRRFRCLVELCRGLQSGTECNDLILCYLWQNKPPHRYARFENLKVCLYRKQILSFIIFGLVRTNCLSLTFVNS